jgi:hypothetical protein
LSWTIWPVNYPAPVFATNIRTGTRPKSKGKLLGGSDLQQEFLKTFLERLETAVATYAVTGSVASNYWGIPRLTHDVDVLVILSAPQIPQVNAAFAAERYYFNESAVRETLQSGGMFNVIDTQTGNKADLWVSTGDAFSQSMLARRKRVELIAGFHAFVATPEDVLLHKLVWHTITPSERQLADAAGIAAVQAGNLDLVYLREWAAKQDTTELLEDALQGKGLKST